LENHTLPAPATLDPTDPAWLDTHVMRRYLIDDASPDRVSLRVFIRPMGLDVIADLEASGDLAPGYAAEIPTFELANSSLDWTMEEGYECGR